MEIFNLLTDGFTTELGKVESQREIKDKNLNDETNLTYGEVSCEAILLIFKQLQRSENNVFKEPGGIFVDLGHGTGKGVLAGALMHSFDRVIGIEILEYLQQKSENLRDRYNSLKEGRKQASFEVY